MNEEDERSKQKKQCFSSIQSRKLLGSLESCNLCPSMDLVVYNASTAIHQHNLYRTMSWQKVAAITTETEDAPATTTTCWSPSGKWIAVANDKHVSLYGVEPVANPPGGGGFNSESTEAQHSWMVDQPVIGLFWAHVGRAHPKAWKSLEDQVEDEISWSYQSQYVDTTKFFLPPSGYLHPSEDDDHHRHQEQTTTTTALPESKTPLSVLCVSTPEHLELYLHGRYRLVSLNRPMAEPATPSRVVVSNDLSYFLVQSGISQLSLYHLPFLKRDRYPLQIVASLHSSISSHLATLRETVVECVNAWKSSLKPLDLKLQPLLPLLQNYGVDDQPLGVILKQYILVGHTSESSSVANAMDQFFTSVQMNDQLLQRMERTLHGALANVESQARKCLLSPMQALCYEVHELAGHVRFHHPKADVAQPLQDLIDASSQLWISVHTLLVSIVQGRHQVRDLCGWLRSAGSQVKARGTAPNSVQRENAKKRRVPQAVIERLLASLNTTPMKSAAAGASLSEHLLNITTSTMLKDTTDQIPLRPKEVESSRPDSPSSVLGLVTSTPTVPHAVKLTGDAFEEVLVNPLSNIPESIVPLDLRLPMESSVFTCLAMRIGRDVLVSSDPWDEEDEADEEAQSTYFSPKIASNDAVSDGVEMEYCRQWAVGATAQENFVQLFAIPLGWRDPEEEDAPWDDEEDAGRDIPFYLTTKMVLPSGGSIRDIGFYGDDGKSSLSSGNDSGTGKERRQKIGILYQQQDSSSSQLELWLASYDSVRWQRIVFTPDLLDHSQIEAFATCDLRPKMEEDDASDDENDDGLVQHVQTRTICDLENPSVNVQLRLCGSRGVGAVAVGVEGTTTIELLDLEEDEEPEEDEEFDEDEE